MALFAAELIDHFATHHDIASDFQLGLTIGRIIGLGRAQMLVQPPRGLTAWQSFHIDRLHFEMLTSVTAPMAERSPHWSGLRSTGPCISMVSTCLFRSCSAVDAASP
ncbi:MAG: hypothetical protein ACJAR2_002151 [Ilumatobacter sp.]|jgi:hypothetical protein